MRRYELHVEGYHAPLTAEQIAELFRAKQVRRNDKCREVGAREWRTIDELFPLLKYDSSSGISGLPPTGSGRKKSAFDGSDQPGDVVRPMSSALKAGWICFGMGAAISWFFPFGNAFFSVAVITAIVAMCTHQVNRGLALLLSSFVAIGLCAVVFFTLVLGTLGVVTGTALKQANENMQRQQAQQRRALNQMTAANQQTQTAMRNTFASIGAPRSAPAAQLQQASRPFDQQQQYDLATARAREQQQRAAAEEQKRQQNIREAERQRDLAKAKEEQLERVQSSIDWWDKMICQAKEQNVSAKIYEDQRDSFLLQKAKLQGY